MGKDKTARGISREKVKGAPQRSKLGKSKRTFLFAFFFFLLLLLLFFPKCVKVKICSGKNYYYQKDTTARYCIKSRAGITR